MMRKLTVMLIAVAALIGVATASPLPAGRDSVIGLGVFSNVCLGGPITYWASNPLTNDTILPGEVVGFCPTIISVVDSYAVGAAYDTATVLDSINNTLDTMDFVPRDYGSSTPRYDAARNGQFYIEMVLRSASNATNDTHYVYIHGYDYQGQPRWVRWWYKSLSTAPLNVDTVFNTVCFSKIDTVYVKCTRANDSIAINAVALFGVKVNTNLASATDSNAYAGVAQGTIYPRHRGLIARVGPNAMVKVNALAADIRNGFWLTPSGTAGYAVASSAMPNIVIGRVTNYSQANGLVMAMLEEPFAGGVGGPAFIIVQAGIDSLQAEADSIRTAATPIAWISTFRAGQFVIPASNGPALVQGDSTYLSFDMLAYDGTTEENAYIEDCIGGYGGQSYPDSVDVEIYWLADTVGLDTVRWMVDFVARGNGQLFDSTLGSGGYILDVSTGRGLLNVCSGTFSVTSFDTREITNLGIGRNPAAGDNMTRDAVLVLVKVKYWLHRMTTTPQ